MSFVVTHQLNISILTYACLVYRQTGRLTRALRFAVRSRLRLAATSKWLHFIESSSVLSQTSDRVRSVLADKIHRPFARCAFTVEQRVDFLIGHYQLAEKLFPPNALLSLVQDDRLMLAKIKGAAEDETYVLTLGRQMISQHQGELTFLMVDEKNNLPLAMLMINLASDEEGRRILILNGIQGPGSTYKGRIVRVTRDLNGLRPKRAVLEAAYAFARWMKAEKIVATAIVNHVSQAKLKWQKKIHADYDDFWREFLPAPLPNGDFDMPLELPRRTAEEVSGKKRKNWLLRQERLQTIASQTEESLGAITP